MGRLRASDVFFKYFTLVHVPMNREVDPSAIFEAVDLADYALYLTDVMQEMARRGRPRKTTIDWMEVDSESLVIKTTWSFEDGTSVEWSLRLPHWWTIGPNRLALLSSLVGDDVIEEAIRRARKLRDELRGVIDKLKEALMAVKLLS